tara:strand:- start:32 stop:1189 length:1158 start_codon:yes stop_codon:yes gene_type:complete
MKKYFYGSHFIDQNDIKSVKLSLNNYLSQGPILKKFENKISKYFNVKYSIAVSSATAGLHLAIMSLKLEKNSIVFLPALTFVATANVCLYAGLKIELVDICKSDFNMNLDELEMKLSKLNKIDKKKRKLIIPVHFGGLPCDMRRIKKIALRYNCYVLEDASQAMGSKFENKLVGNCNYSDACIFSLHPVKSITTGEGGLVLTNSKKIKDKTKLLRSHGLKKDNKYHWKNDMIELGFNYKITEFQSALGISQLRKLKKFILKRKKISEFYLDKLKKLNLKFQNYQKIRFDHAYHYFIIKFENIQKNRIENFVHNLTKYGIYAGRQYKPINLHSFYKSKFKSKFPVSEDYFHSSIQIPIYPKLDKNDCKYIVEKLIYVIKKFSKNKK